MSVSIRWEESGAYDGDNRRLMFVGHAAVGAIFLPTAPRARYVRWRVWVTAKMNPVEGAARREASAKAEVEKRFDDFLMLAGLKGHGE